MVFNSLTFLMFFGGVLLLHNLPFSWRTKKANLLVASYLFYAAWNPPFVLLIIFSTIVDWCAARAMARAGNKRLRRLLLIASLSANLGLLVFFKYANFLLETFVVALNGMGVHFQPAAPDIILPVGISFYTFQTLSYTIDVYKRRSEPWGSFLDFALFVTFFPQLVAGPIVRSAEFLPQCNRERRTTADALGWGLSLLLIGLFHKVVLADALLGPIADKVYGAEASPVFFEAWSGTLAFAGQIFCDFFGYSTCAIGVALCLGFSLPDNFRFPYAAIGFSDFWRRWHISLSAWLRDYLYISLGGNRCSRWRNHANLMVTMLLGGLWHGASWTFVVWGGLHGFCLVAERYVKRLLGARSWARQLPAMILGAVVTYVIVCLIWVFFRAHEFSTAFGMVVSMLSPGTDAGEILASREMLGVLAVTTVMLLTHWLMRNTNLEEVAARLPWMWRAVFMAAAMVLTVTSAGDDRAFIYFQF